jgi:hypothetical protein
MAIVGASLMLTAPAEATWSPRYSAGIDQFMQQSVGGCYSMGWNEHASGSSRTGYTVWYGGSQRSCIGLSVNYLYTVNGVPLPAQWSSWKYTTSSTQSRVSYAVTATNIVYFGSGHRGQY